MKVYFSQLMSMDLNKKNIYQCYNKCSFKSKSDEFQKGSCKVPYDTTKTRMYNMNDNLISNVKAGLSGDKNQKLKYLNNFYETSSLIFRSYSEEEVTSTVQYLIDSAVNEKDEDIFSLYINIIHKAVCPNTGVGKFVNTKNLNFRLNNRKSVDKLGEQIISETGN